MRVCLLIFVLLPAVLSHEHLRIKIEVSKDFLDVKADASGDNEQVITDDELKIFGITDTVLKNGVWEISRSKPDAVFVKDSKSTRYRNYDYDEVTRELDAEEATVLNVQVNPYVIDSKQVTNQNSHASEIDAGFPLNFTNKISTSWGRFNGINDSNTEVEYQVKFEGRGTRLYGMLPWGRNTENSPLEAVSEEGSRCSNSFIELGPKETVTAELVATELTVDILVQYEVDFDGDVVCHYVDGNFYEKIEIEDVLKRSHFPEKLIINEYVRLVVYSDARVLVKRNNS